MRSFIAVELPENVKEAIGNYIDSLGKLIDNVKWVAPGNLHLTIKFLGDVKESDVRNINDCILNVSSESSPFVIGLSHIDFFPSRKNPRVIWLRVDGGEDCLIDVFHDLENHLDDLGFDRE